MVNKGMENDLRRWMRLVESEAHAQMLIDQISQMALVAKVVLVQIDDTTVELRSMYASQRGQGAGSVALRAITSLADQLGVTLECLPRSAVDHGWDHDEDFTDAPDQRQLEAWYGRYGFTSIPNRDPDGDMEFDEYLIRHPKLTRP